ncbi:MAG TPA: glycoside hydrolase family 3 N-terminal domain-containing protein [Flexivirga sp.]|uniref:glycoside hydrolase family 3 N-terminal domain-containing protein n=1 Tax=Flexivirga sp. TaxID=1962927 RepID=UPI002BDF1832|nr:glycoside hydrolase family 3 N-terminal domain-containing protein [Flexivirga sp.]HWC22818.1 glycoside hydrolase family 3 N-terminal domain-containing protein [Flexivirga sp.]
MMNIFRGRPLVLGTTFAIATAGMSIAAAAPSHAAAPAAATLASCPSYPVIYYGMTGSCVKLAQQLLIKHGYSVGSSGADGIFGSATRSAVERFQSARLLNSTGVVDDLTWKALLRFGAAGSACVTETYNEMTVPQRLGQLIMVGMTSGNQSTVHGLIANYHVGNIVYLGGWSGDGTVGRTSDGLQRRTSNSATDGVAMLIGADQEGGYVQQLTGTGFTRLPTALTQGTWSSSQQYSTAATVGQQLRNVGVGANLAPVTDTVPQSLGTRNGPIGHYYREYGYTPSVVTRAVTNVVHGLNSRREVATLKHFPGIGRILNNTDTSSTGITDNTMTSTDPYLSPFQAGVNAGAGMVMVGLAWYPKIDSVNQAPFSFRIITTILRHNLGFKGVVVSDSMSAVAVQRVPVGDRAVRFISAGGDMVLTGSTSEVPTMLSAIGARVRTSSTFAWQVNYAIHRILALKAAHGLLFCR